MRVKDLFEITRSTDYTIENKNGRIKEQGYIDRNGYVATYSDYEDNLIIEITTRFTIDEEAVLRVIIEEA